MKLSVASAALVLAYTSCIQAAPASFGTTSELTKRETGLVAGAIEGLEDYNAKRSDMSEEELIKRESQIVTDVLSAIKNTGLAPDILKYLTTDDTFAPISRDTIVFLVKNGVINIDTLLKSLNDSGLAVDVIQNLIEDCTFYADIYKLAASYIGDLAGKIADDLGFKKREEFIATHLIGKRAVKADVAPRASEEEILTSLMESLKNSGLADQVVRELVVDPDFLSFGADLIEELFKQDAISLGELIDALLDSGLIPSLIEAFLNLGTFNTVITNALAAAFGKCDGASVTSSVTESATKTETGGPSPTSSGGSGICRKKKRSYNY